MYDIIIIGGASAGLTAAIYAARKKLNTFILTEKVGGQSLLTDNIENYPGFKKISGYDLTAKVREQAEAVGVEIQEEKIAVKIEKAGDNFKIQTKDGEFFEARAVIVANGKKHRLLNVPGEKEFTGKGVSYCSVCDAPLFSGKDTAVVGAGNAGLEAAMDLTKYADKIYVLEFSSKIRGDESTEEKLEATGKVDFITEAAVKEIKGEQFVNGLVYENRKNRRLEELKVQGVFVNIGQIPGTDFVKDFLKLNEQKEIIIDLETNAASVPGIFAAGDVTNVKFKQCIIAAGEGAKAALSAYDYLQK